MAYDSTMDKEVFSEQIEFENCRITVGVFSYNNGPSKLQISRENVENGEYKFAKLGRLTRHEAEKVIPAMEKALKHM